MSARCAVWAALLLLLGLGCAGVPSVELDRDVRDPATLDAPASALGDLRVERIAPDVHVLRGADEMPAPANAGRVANVGVISGPHGAVVVGTGTSAADGAAILAAARALTGQPVVLAINTHAAPEHVLGNAAFARAGVPILAHRATDDFMAHHCDACIRSHAALVGAQVLGEARLVRAGRLIDRSETITAGGRALELLYFGPSQQPGGIAVFDRASGVIFAGGLASFGVVPDAREADLPGWLAALRALRALPATRVVPGRGVPDAPARLDRVAAYVRDLERETTLAYARGASLSEAVSAVTLAEYGHWAGYAQMHARNVHFQYLKREAAELAGATSAPQ